MATYIFLKRIMGKVKFDYFFCLNGDIWNLFLQKCLLSIYFSYVQIAKFDWLPGRQKW